MKVNPYTLGQHKSRVQGQQGPQPEPLHDFCLDHILVPADVVAQQEVPQKHPHLLFPSEHRNSDACYDALRAYQPQIVLFAPQIPQNAGTVARMCAAFCMHLHLIKPLGFEINERAFRRPGLDYWKFVRFTIHESWAAFQSCFSGRRYVFIETQQSQNVSSFCFKPGDLLIFGPETTGLPSDILSSFKKETSPSSPSSNLTNSCDKVTEKTPTQGFSHALVQVPMWHPGVRSINLASTVAIVGHAALSDLSSRAEKEMEF